jgi:hypothetical protein
MPKVSAELGTVGCVHTYFHDRLLKDSPAEPLDVRPFRLTQPLLRIEDRAATSAGATAEDAEPWRLDP